MNLITKAVNGGESLRRPHSLALTCALLSGFVQIPCIGRSAIYAGKAITASRMAVRGDGTHLVSLDEVIDTMRATGRDMKLKVQGDLDRWAWR
ncbi:L-serine ammonia-lyase, iron-sulfur-dependent, subunit alpha [Saccharopolyspora pogona]|uniref:L-serine ammonia-lyase, iron-sulfur-dependent, subunit alpha n=1 Tax=Saccharopolyspora pogona TaxID=333966 RepID=UPI001687E230